MDAVIKDTLCIIIFPIYNEAISIASGNAVIYTLYKEDQKAKRKKSIMKYALFRTMQCRFDSSSVVYELSSGQKSSKQIYYS